VDDMNKTMITGLLALALGSAFAAQATVPPTAQPATQSGDAWTYRSTKEIGANGWTQTRDEITVARVTSTSIYYTTHEAGSSQPARDVVGGADWSRVRNVNGKETVVNQPMSFPLTAGKSWTIEYHEDHPNKAHRFEESKSTYTVVGMEKVTVPAGTFDAIKVEAEGHWLAELEPGSTVVQGAQTTAGATSMQTEARKVVAEPVEGRTYKALWYVPAQRRWVKSVEEFYGGNGVRTERYTTELESSKLAE
jgi:hypothetical protein